MWYSSFGIRPGSQYDAGTMNVTSIMSIAEAICMFLVKMQLLMYKILTTDELDAGNTLLMTLE